MGAAFVTMKAKGTPAEVKQQFESAQGRDRYENGHMYSGGFGMCRGLAFATPNKVYTEHDAYEYTVEAAQKWGAALAVKLGDAEYFIGAWCAE